MKRELIKSTYPLTLTFLVMPGISAAQGLLDVLDPCAAQTDQYYESRKSYFSDLSEAEAKMLESRAASKMVGSAAAPQDFKVVWWNEKRKLLREYYDTNLAPTVLSSGGDVERGFESFYADIKKKHFDRDATNQVIEEDYERAIDNKFYLAKAQAETQFSEQKKSLESACPKDVLSQVLRGAVTAVTAPVNIVQGNLDAASQEQGIFNQAIRGTTGISIHDIEKNGILGGENSELRKIFGGL